MKKSQRHRALKWFWWGNVPICVGLYLWAYGVSFDPKGLLILYLAIVSVTTQATAEASTEEGAETNEATG